MEKAAIYHRPESEMAYLAGQKPVSDSASNETCRCASG